MKQKQKLPKGVEKMTFTGFLALDTNRNAKRVAKSFLLSANPILLVNGPVGSGKTHLAVAILNQHIELDKDFYLLCSGMELVQSFRKAIICDDSKESIEKFLSDLFESYGLIIVDAADALFGGKYSYRYGKSLIEFLANNFNFLKQKNKKIIITFCDENHELPWLHCSLDYPSKKELSKIYDKTCSSIENCILMPEDKSRILNQNIKSVREIEAAIIAANSKRLMIARSKVSLDQRQEHQI